MENVIIKYMKNGQKKTELFLYLFIWAILFAAPVASMYISAVATHTSTFNWRGVYNAWMLMALFFATFCIHNFFLAPLLVYHNRRLRYALTTILLIVLFMTSQMFTVTHHFDDGPFDKERTDMPPRQEPQPGSSFDEGRGKRPMNDLPPHGERQPRAPLPPMDDLPPRAFGGQDMVAFIIMSLLLGLNIGAKYYFKSIDDRKRLRDLERDNLNTQLQYLKYQINPHFFMNTLNNIHALVLIDPKQANETIETFSRLMRYVLYDGNKTMAPLKKELDFIKNFIDLMRVRYTEQVSVEVSIPETVPNVLVPSLLFATFIENAFKHGVSYEAASYIKIEITAEEKQICFKCTNSRNSLPDKDNNGGIGLANARKRLKLVYGHQYNLLINPTETEYKVVLTLPVIKQSSETGNAHNIL